MSIKSSPSLHQTSLVQVFFRFDGPLSSLHPLLIPAEASLEVSSSRVLAEPRMFASIRGSWKERDRPTAVRGGSIGEAIIDSWVELVRTVEPEGFGTSDGAVCIRSCVATIDLEAGGPVCDPDCGPDCESGLVGLSFGDSRELERLSDDLFRRAMASSLIFGSCRLGGEGGE